MAAADQSSRRSRSSRGFHPRAFFKRFASRRDFLALGLPTIIVALAALAVGIKALGFAPPSTIRFVCGPEGSGYRTQAEKYQQILRRYGVKVELVASQGSLDNLRKLADRKVKAEVGFVQGGLTDGIDTTGLVSLGTV